ncbi:uncharacterized protein [Procambarus clarkii]|uniref:uncharacterized protein n=1 Tax=Procambarus clarkii TaxID=6728 RepID=UPI001E670B06|nr:endoglucanase E-4-like [Procambarus clarkii]WGC43865.1 GH9-7 [Procambarus clarkii]
MTGALTRTFLLGVAALLHTGWAYECEYVTIGDAWEYNYGAVFSAPAPADFSGLVLDLYFNRPVDSIDFYDGTTEKVDDHHFILREDSLSGSAGDVIEFKMQVHFPGAQAVVTAATLNGVPLCEGGYTTVTPFQNPCDPTGMSPYDYAQVLCMGILFYEAERSGHLPADQRVTWRYDSALDDGSDVGHDLTGGYYDAGDHVKFGFPMAFSATMIAWGLLDFADGYEAAGQTEYGRDALKWATDYFLKAYTAHWEFYGQVGNGGIDHAYWGRPEDMTMERPSYKIDEQAPGSELAGETAAALAAASIVFKDVDPAYSAQVLAVASELYEFADAKREHYHISIPDAAGYYQSWSGYYDELLWAALWLNRATGDSTYLDRARGHYAEIPVTPNNKLQQFSWDDKRAGAFSLGTLLDPDFTSYATDIQAYIEYLKNEATYTPKGLVYLDTWGPNRHAANVAFLFFWNANQGLDPEENRQWATKQIDYILGDTGRSFVVGFGVDPPRRPHHRSSSCPSLPGACDDGWADKQPGPNPQTLYGALVGGPGQDDSYTDDRMDYVHNEVACDYNAAFVGALAALVELH